MPAFPAEEQRAKEILARRADKDWTLCHAISFAVLDARHVTRAFTFAHHSRQHGRIRVLGLNVIDGDEPGRASHDVGVIITNLSL